MNKAIKHRAVFFGYFLGENAFSHSKKAFWIDSLKSCEHWQGTYLIIENDFQAAKMALEQGEKAVHFPVSFSLSHNKVGLNYFLEGLLVIFSLGVCSPRFLITLVIKEMMQLKSRKSIIYLIAFPFLLINGLGRLRQLFRNNKLGENDVFILWGQHLTTHQVIARWVKKRGGLVMYTEGAELQGSVFVSEHEILNNSWPRLYDDTFQALPVASETRALAVQYIDRLCQNRFSNKKYDESNEVLQEFISEGKPIIYVNGLENFASGLRPRIAKSSKAVSPLYASNNKVIERVLELADKYDWNVVYKDHPNTFLYAPNLLIKNNNNPRLWILSNIDIHEVMDHADAMVSLCSKVVLLALCRGIPVSLAGPFSIAADNLKFGLKEDPELEQSLLEALSKPRGERVDKEGLTCLIARMMSYFAYKLPSAPWESSKNSESVWLDIIDYLEGKRDVVSCDIRLPK